jgi:hypothetical protein
MNLAEQHGTARAADRTPTYEGRPLANPAEEIFDQGLAFDLETMLDRRKLVELLGYYGLGAGLLALAGCGSSGGAADGSASQSAAAATTSGATTGDCQAIPEETAGPYPGDGSNGPDVLSQSGVVRSDIRSSFGELSGVAGGSVDAGYAVELSAPVLTA